MPQLDLQRCFLFTNYNCRCCKGSDNAFFFFSLFGLLKVVQTDQGSIFMSCVCAQVLKQLNIKHCHSSAYHPESRGALEHFHQTFKTMLCTYCLEFERYWDDGLPVQMFARRQVVQESLRFSPSELVFAHTVRSPLKLLSEKWLCEGTVQNVLDYVSNFRFILRRACEIARNNLKTAEARVKGWFDKHAKSREFQPGDNVLNVTGLFADVPSQTQLLKHDIDVGASPPIKQHPY